MTTEIEFKDAVEHLVSYTFSSISRYIDEQLKSKQTPYSLYMKEKHEELKEEIPDISVRSKTISTLWKNEDKELKKNYEQRAKDYVPEEKKNEPKKRAKGLNNFQFFCKVERDKFVKKNEGDKKQSTRQLSDVWKNIKDDKKGEYKNAAEEYNKNPDDYQELVNKLSVEKVEKVKKTKNKV